MRRLFHAFPRPRAGRDRTLAGIIRDEPVARDHIKGFEILKLILQHGLLCTPEDLPLFPDTRTERPEKRALLERDLPHKTIRQSRACFTLMDSHELALQYEVDRGGRTVSVSHSQLFGPFAVGLDAIEARELGILPTVYYYRNSDRDSASGIEGLGYQNIHRLDEISTVFSILSHIEARASSTAPQVPTIEMLGRLGIDMPYERNVLEQVNSLSERDANRVMKLFDTDRVAAWNIVDFVKMLLSLYQTVDSTREYSPLAFFQQREWRLIHHMCEGMSWFSLGDNPEFADPEQRNFADIVSEIREFVTSHASARSSADLRQSFRRSWVLNRVGMLPFRDYVREIVVPRGYAEATCELLRQLSFARQRPDVVELSAPWKREPHV